MFVCGAAMPTITLFFLVFFYAAVLRLGRLRRPAAFRFKAVCAGGGRNSSSSSFEEVLFCVRFSKEAYWVPADYRRTYHNPGRAFLFLRMRVDIAR